jgi:hypothetical protein
MPSFEEEFRRSKAISNIDESIDKVNESLMDEDFFKDVEGIDISVKPTKEEDYKEVSDLIDSFKKLGLIPDNDEDISKELNSITQEVAKELGSVSSDVMDIEKTIKAKPNPPRKSKPYKGKAKKKKVPLIMVRNIDTTTIHGPMTYVDAGALMGIVLSNHLINAIGTGKAIRARYGVYEMKYSNDNTRWVTAEPGRNIKYVIEEEKERQLKIEEELSKLEDERSKDVIKTEAKESRYKELLITNKILSLTTDHINPILKNFPKYERINMCRDIRDYCNRLGASMNMAAKVPSKRLYYSQEADGHLEALRYCLVVSAKQRYIGLVRLDRLILAIDEISKLISGYIKSAITRNKHKKEAIKQKGTDVDVSDTKDTSNVGDNK